jgi:hypothetical protein
VGAWGNGPFDNDDALDLVGELADSGRPLADDLRRVLDPGGVRRSGWFGRFLGRQPRDEPVESDDVNDFTVVAAAAVVAAALGLDVGQAQVSGLLERKPLSVTKDLRSVAGVALARATGTESEWFELWQDSGELERTQAETDRVRQVLQRDLPAPR